MGTVIGDACSWKGQLERTWSWKVRNEIAQNEAGKLEPKLETTFQVGKSLKLKINFKRNYPTSLGSFQLKQKLPNFRLSKLEIPTPYSFQLHISLFLDLI